MKHVTLTHNFIPYDIFAKVINEAENQVQNQFRRKIWGRVSNPIWQQVHDLTYRPAARRLNNIIVYGRRT